MTTRVETRPMSPFARARTSTDMDTTTKLRALIDKVSILIEEEQKHNKALQESIHALSTSLHTQTSVLTRTATTLESRITTLETTLLMTLEERNQIQRERDFLLAVFERREIKTPHTFDHYGGQLSPCTIEFHNENARKDYESWAVDRRGYDEIVRLRK